MSKVEEDWQEMTCPVCGRSFYVNSYRQQRRYCSVTCRNKAEYRRKCKRAGKSMGRQVKRCEVCGEEFVASRSDARYCSRKCQLARYRMTHPVYKTRQKHWMSDECYEAARVAVSALSESQVDELRWAFADGGKKDKVLRMWLEDSDTARLKEIRGRMG